MKFCNYTNNTYLLIYNLLYQFIECFRSNMIYRKNIVIHFEDYNIVNYTGSLIEYIWKSVEDLSTTQRFDFNKSDF